MFILAILVSAAGDDGEDLNAMLARKRAELLAMEGAAEGETTITPSADAPVTTTVTEPITVQQIDGS